MLGAGEQSLTGDWVIPPALADEPASVMGEPDMPHTYSFSPDIGENLVRLGERDDALGLVNRTVREINAMRYEFDEPFIANSSRAETELGLRATPLADAVDRTVRWYRAQASASSAADRKRAEQVAPGWEQAS